MSRCYAGEGYEWGILAYEISSRNYPGVRITITESGITAEYKNKKYNSAGNFGDLVVRRMCHWLYMVDKNEAQ